MAFPGRVVEKVFLDHPHALGESYWQHQRRASQFATSMIGAGLACLIHALVPALFERSRTVQSLYDEMHARRRLGGLSPGAPIAAGREALPGY